MATSERWWDRTFASFARPAFRTYYIGLLCNMAGFWLRIAATNWFAYELTGSSASLGIITMAALLPWVPIAPIAGVWAERIDQRKYLLGVYLGVAIVNFILAAGITAGYVAWNELLVATVLISVLRGMELPARHAIVRRIVDLRLLSNAIGLNAAGFHVMNAVGFAVAGVLYKFAGPDGCFYAVGASSLGMAIVLSRASLLGIVLLIPALVLGIRAFGDDTSTGQMVFLTATIGTLLIFLTGAFILWWRRPLRGHLAAWLNLLAVAILVLGFGIVHPLVLKGGL